MSSSLQFRIANYQALIAKYNFLNYAKFEKFFDSLLQQDRARFLIDEGKLIASTTPQSVIDAADISSRAVSTAIIHRESRLHASGLPKEVQNTIEDLPFDESHLFNEKTDESLHTMKDSRATLYLLGIYTLARKRKFHCPSV